MLIADDSVVLRQGVTSALAGDPEIVVIGAVRNGLEAVARVRAEAIDVVVMDVEMPVLDGIGALKEIRRTHPKVAVIMFSTLTQHGSRATVEALTAGAADYVAKPESGSIADSLDRIRHDLVPKIKAVGAGATRRPTSVTVPPTRGVPLAYRPSVVVIGASTGGPNALVELLRATPTDFAAPILIAQHMPAGFTRTLAERLSSLTPHSVAEATNGAMLSPGQIVVAPGDYHMLIAPAPGGRLQVELNQAAPENQVRPAVDVLFRSAAKCSGTNALALVLTGMGQDGLRGCEAIRKAGGMIMVQDEASSIVWGMPGAVAKAHLADAILPIPELARILGSSRGRTGPIPLLLSKVPGAATR
ncbi:MAG: chemotaxis response regulator protein-glutamate methylesterase [Deltaproteobacteria bacterium]|nr:chemotaxis response regulator protein-glutamate methylesterase [Deltaproteobacteria bacterium]